MIRREKKKKGLRVAQCGVGIVAMAAGVCVRACV